MDLCSDDYLARTRPTISSSPLRAARGALAGPRLLHIGEPHCSHSPACQQHRRKFASQACQAARITPTWGHINTQSQAQTGCQLAGLTRGSSSPFRPVDFRATIATLSRPTMLLLLLFSAPLASLLFSIFSFVSQANWQCHKRQSGRRFWAPRRRRRRRRLFGRIKWRAASQFNVN